MDKLKEQLAPVLKHLFWIGCGLILLVALFSWYSSTSGLKSEYTRLKSDIDGKISSVNAIQGNHPNDNTLKGMDLLLQARGEEVAKKWSRLTENQEDVLVWPSAVFDQEFIEVVEPLRPPELKVTGQFDTEISEVNRRFYRNYLNRVFPDLAKIIGAKWSGKVQAGGGMGGMMSMMGGAGAPGAMMAPGDGADTMTGMGQDRAEPDDSIVLWDSGNQSQLLSVHFGFIGSDDLLPSTLQVLYAQEDLWVLESLLQIIRATNEANGEISHRHEAAIKVLQSVQIGQSAVKEAGKITSVGGGSSGGGGEAPGMEMGAEMMAAMTGGMGGADAGASSGAMPGGDTAADGAEGMSGGMGAMGGAGGKPHPADNRYVDRDYKPVLSQRLIAAMKGQPQKPEDLFLAVAKRVPVRLNLKMDQRRLATLLAECSNSKLPVEVKQIRINRQSGGGMGGGAGGDMAAMGAGGATDMMAEMMGGMGGAMPGGDDGGAGGFGGFGGQANNPERKKIADSSIDINEISVELYGIVYIYNPVNRQVLGLSESPEPAAATPTLTPASNPPAVPAVPAPNTGAVLGPATGTNVN